MNVRSRVFLSCGQRREEKEIAGKIAELLENRGFDVYIAIDVQTILEINSGIICELKNSDCYLFVNFRRDPIPNGHQGSLFSNQELAIAFSLGFEAASRQPGRRRARGNGQVHRDQHPTIQLV